MAKVRNFNGNDKKSISKALAIEKNVFNSVLQLGKLKNLK
jgi:hypothetical protein